MRRRALGWIAALGLAGCGEPPDPPQLRPTADKPMLRATYKGRTVEAWLPLAGHESAAQRADAAWAMAEIGVGDERALAALRSLAADGDADVRFAAYGAAGRLRVSLGVEAAERLVADLGSPGTAMRQAALSAVAPLGEAVVPFLERGMESADARQRWAALRGLHALGTAPAGVLPKVRRLALEDEDASVRRAALMAAPNLGPEGVALAVEELRSEDFRRHHVAAAALAEAGARSVPGLVPLLAEADEVVAARAAGVLADIGRAAEPALPALLQAIRREGPARFNAQEALVAIGEPAVPALEALANGEDATLAALAADAIARIRRRP